MTLNLGEKEDKLILAGGDLKGRKGPRDTPLTYELRDEVAKLTGIKFLFLPGMVFRKSSGATGVLLDDADFTNDLGGNMDIYTVIDLPVNATITRVDVYGSATTTPWILYRKDLVAGTKVQMATANIGSGTEAITYATLDTEKYGYFIFVATFPDTKAIYGVKITYKI